MKTAAAAKAVIQSNVIHHRRRGAGGLEATSVTMGSADIRLWGAARRRLKDRVFHHEPHSTLWQRGLAVQVTQKGRWMGTACV